MVGGHKQPWRGDVGEWRARATAAAQVTSVARSNTGITSSIELRFPTLVHHIRTLYTMCGAELDHQNLIMFVRMVEGVSKDSVYRRI